MEVSKEEIGKRYQEAKKDREKRVELASQGLRTLCILSGYEFGSNFEVRGGGHSWSSPSDSRWPSIISQINSWAVYTFAPELRESLGLPGTN